MLREHNVVRLATKTPSHLLRNTYKFTPEHGNPFEYRTQIYEDALVRGFEFQHLYLTSDDTIKIDDCVKHTSNDIGFVISINSGTYDMIFPNHVIAYNLTLVNAKKVIATTDSKLWKINASYKGVDKIPLSFVQAYVEKEGKIDKVKLEYNDNIYSNSEIVIKEGTHLRLRTDGSVVVYPYKERMIPIKAIREFLNEYELYRGIQVFDYQITEWLDKHYPNDK